MNIVRAFLFLLFISLLYTLPAAAQDEPTAAWQVTRFDITTTVPANERALAARAQLAVRNVGRGPGSSLTLRISPKAEVKAASVGDATATFRAGEIRNELQLVRLTLPAAVAPGASVNVALDYRLPLSGNTGYAALSPAGSQFLPQPTEPLSHWYPAHSTAASPRGPDVAPVRLTINGAGGDTVISSGKASGSSFEQTLNGQPFFLTGSWDASEGAGDARGVTAFIPKGAGDDARRRADELVALAAAARSYYASLLGPAPDVPVRLVAVRRGAGFSDGGTLLLDAAAFRRPKVDAMTALSIAESVARLWVGGVAPVRGDGGGVLREGLTRYLATLFLEKQFGREVADAERARERAAYATVARRDGPLARTSQLDPTYFNSTGNKGAMFWRLVERAMGQDALMAQLRAAIQRGAGGPEGLTLASLRAVLAEQGGAGLKNLMDQSLDQPTDMDLMVGLPQQRGPQWAVALRNSGSVDASVTVAATTATGERLTAQATIPARNFGEATFTTPARLARVEVDPDKLYPQLDYSNDVAPRGNAQAEDPLTELTAKFARQDYAGAEASARELLAASPRMQEARIVLARSLLAQNKTDEAEREFRALVDERLPLPLALAWGNIGLAEIALRKGQSAEAARLFTNAVLTDAEYASTLAARLGRIRAEAAASASPAVDESAKTFITQLDAAIKSGRKAELEALVTPGELTEFVAGIVGSQPEIWQTRVVRTEQLDANRLAADVQLTTKQLGRDASGTAVLFLARAGSGWKLDGVGFFEVR
ncbi:MAG TPA: tetratricopeptide repeat protein [Pyrinomonadaceae bacterium]|nr:tetratricopeptide repeat protein [Pyrinomonadaceae bacterium]